MTGQSLKRQDCVETAGRASVFATDLGWFALAGSHDFVSALTIGHGSEDDARRSLTGRLRQNGIEAPEDCDWNPVLRRQLQAFATGEHVDFDDVKLSLPPRTDFQQAIVRATRAIPFGETQTYSELANAAGFPRAARAVGNVMASNCVPIIVPCHRVVAADGKYGGFSAPQGVDLKRRMLELEAGEGNGSSVLNNG